MTDQEKMEYAWNCATIAEGYNPDIVRKDACGAWIMKTQYGDRTSVYGWEVDHVYPQAKGGDDFEQNLRAMHWENNLSKGDDYPSYIAVVRAEGNMNVRKETPFSVNNQLQKVLASHYHIV